MTDAFEMLLSFISKVAMQLLFIVSVLIILGIVITNNDNYIKKYLSGSKLYESFSLEQGLNYSGGYLLFQGNVNGWNFVDEHGNKIEIDFDKLYLLKDTEKIILEVVVL